MLKIVVATSLAALVTGFSTVPKTPMGDEMIDEASRKMALVIAGQGRAAGMQRTGERFSPLA